MNSSARTNDASERWATGTDPDEHRGGAGLSIALLVCYYPYVSHTFVQREVEGLRRLGVDVHTVSVRDPGPGNVLSAADRASSQTTVNLVPPAPGHLLRTHARAFLRHPAAYLGTLSSAVRGAQPNVRARLWQVFYFAEAMLLWDVCRRRGLRHVHVHFANNAADVARLVTRYGTATDSRPWTWSLTMHGPTEFAEVSRFDLPDKVRSASFVACISDFCRSQLMALVEEEHWDKLGIVHCGVDLERLQPVSDDMRHGPLRILCVGRLVSEKGQGLLIQAAAELLASGRDVEVVLVGDGPRRKHLEQLAHRSGIAGAVTFAGSVGQDDILSWFAWADVFVLPSFAEGVPVALMEAMACELPVVTTRIAGISELVQDGGSGFLCAPGRVDQVRSALERLHDDPALRRSMGRAGRSTVADHYNTATTTQPLVALLHTRAPAARP